MFRSLQRWGGWRTARACPGLRMGSVECQNPWNACASVFAAKSLEDLWVKIGECVWFILKFRLSPSHSLLGDAVAIPHQNLSARWLMNLRYLLIPNDGTIMEWMTLPKKKSFDHGIPYHCQHRWMRMRCPNDDERDTDERYSTPWQNFAVTPWNWQTHLLFFFCVFENEATRMDPTDYHGYTLIYLALSSLSRVSMGGWKKTPSAIQHT